jgi:hypothetical protein
LPVVVVAAGTGAGAAGGAAWDGAADGCSGVVTGVAAAPGSPMRASGVPTGTVSPAATRI